MHINYKDLQDLFCICNSCTSCVNFQDRSQSYIDQLWSLTIFFQRYKHSPFLALDRESSAAARIVNHLEILRGILVRISNMRSPRTKRRGCGFTGRRRAPRLPHRTIPPFEVVSEATAAAVSVVAEDDR